MPLNRRQFLSRSGIGVAALGGVGSSSHAQESSRRPNYLVIFTDDQTYRAIGYNNPAVRTPNLDALAAGGVIFDHAYIASPICVASRASIQTGLFPQQHEAVGLDATGFKQCVVNEGRVKTLAHYLSEAGYTTAYCGKSHLGDPKLFGYAQGQEHGDTTDAAAFAYASEFLGAHPANGAPFLLWLSARQPHVPLVPEQKWLELYNRADLAVDPNFMESPPDGSIYNQGLPGERYYRDSEFKKNYKDLPSGPPRSKETMLDFIHAYYATISRLDHQIGELVERLKATGHYENTVILFLADNGYHLGNHGLGNKITMHEESVRIPMFMHWADNLPKGTRCKALVSSIDVLPTLLTMADRRPPDHLAGKSLVPLLDNAHASFRDYVFSECVGVGGKTGMGHRMARSQRWKYVLTDSNEEALFDEVADPYELTNVATAESNRTILNAHRDALRHWMESIGDTHAPPPLQT